MRFMLNFYFRHAMHNVVSFAIPLNAVTRLDMTQMIKHVTLDGISTPLIPNPGSYTS